MTGVHAFSSAVVMTHIRNISWPTADVIYLAYSALDT